MGERMRVRRLFSSPDGGENESEEAILILRWGRE
jgi:hypothetical protein